MTTATMNEVSVPGNGSLWAGRILSGFAVAFLTMDTAMKVLRLPVAIEGSAKLGFKADTVFALGLLCTVLLVLYLVKRTAILGAVLWTGYLGGAICVHVREGNPLFSHVLFPIYVAIFLWGGLWLRDARLRRVFDKA